MEVADTIWSGLVLIALGAWATGEDGLGAWAIREGFKELSLLGLNMTVYKEYIEQKPGMEFWLGIALGKGIKINLQHDQCSLLKTRDSNIYGYFMRQWRVY